jgi:hypothetical protein
MRDRKHDNLVRLILMLSTTDVHVRFALQRRLIFGPILSRIEVEFRQRSFRITICESCFRRHDDIIIRNALAVSNLCAITKWVEEQNMG